MMTLNNIISLFNNIQVAHHNLNGFGFGNLFEINGSIKEGLAYPLLWITPVDSVTTENTQQRRFNLLIADQVSKDKSDRNDVWSDTERIMNDIVKIIRNESDSYELFNEPVLTPFDEQHGDWVTGWQTELIIQTDFPNNYCDIPSDTFVSPVLVPGYGVIKNIETGETIKTLKKGETYYIQILDTVEQSLDTITPTIIQVLT